MNSQVNNPRKCGSGINLDAVRSNPTLLQRFNTMEQKVQQYKSAYGGANNPNARLIDPNGVIVIPIVVHIIYAYGSLWNITSPATVLSGTPGQRNVYVSFPSTFNGQVTLNATWNGGNQTSDLPITLGYGIENSTYNRNCYNSYPIDLRINGSHTTCYNTWTTGIVAFTGATGPAQSWRVVSSYGNPTFSGSGNNFQIYFYGPYHSATIEAIVPTGTCSRTIQYFFLSSMLSYNYAISPNPAYDNIMITAAPNNNDPTARLPQNIEYEVQLYNSFNQLLKKVKNKQGSPDVPIDISSFPSNQFYTVRLISGNDTQIQKFFKR